MSSLYEMTHPNDANKLVEQQRNDDAPKRRDEQVGKIIDMVKDDLDEVLASLDPLAFVELLSFVASYLEAINDIVGDARIDFPDTDMGVDAGKLNKATRSVLFGIRKAKEILK